MSDVLVGVRPADLSHGFQHHRFSAQTFMGRTRKRCYMLGVSVG
jgi:hypothetical protein